MKITLLAFVSAALGLVFTTGLQAQTADECIAEYENLKSQFEATALEAEVTCIKKGHMTSLEREGAFPANCKGQGKWDHWHLEAGAIGSNEGSCKMMLRGQEGVAGEFAVPARRRQSPGRNRARST